MKRFTGGIVFTLFVSLSGNISVQAISFQKIKVERPGKEELNSLVVDNWSLLRYYRSIENLLKFNSVWPPDR